LAVRLRAEWTGEYFAGTQIYRSSTRLKVSWQPAERPAHRYVLSATGGRSSVTAESAGTEVVLERLKSATEYRLTLKACFNASCEAFADSDIAAAMRTPAEYWQIRGTGNSFATAELLIAGGNVAPSAFRYGEWAGEELLGRVALEYVPIAREDKGVKVASAAAQGEPFTAAPGYAWD
jgi:hypothetical protein